jgi:hypothetical protein
MSLLLSTAGPPGVQKTPLGGPLPAKGTLGREAWVEKKRREKKHAIRKMQSPWT